MRESKLVIGGRHVDWAESEGGDGEGGPQKWFGMMDDGF